MITGELRTKIDSVWNDFWSGGIANPLEVMEQLTYLLFIKGLDERQTLAENKANQTGQRRRVNRVSSTRILNDDWPGDLDPNGAVRHEN